MKFVQYYLDCLSQASYLIGDETTGRAVVVDPRRDIDDYVLLMRTISDDFDEFLTIEINEEQMSGENLITEARLVGNTLGLKFSDPAKDWQGTEEFTLSFEETDDNLSSIESGAFRVLGDALKGGSA